MPPCQSDNRGWLHRYPPQGQWVTIQRSHLYVKAKIVNENGDARALKDTSALYSLLKTEVKTFAVGKGQYNVNLDDIFQGKIPNRLTFIDGIG